MIREKGKIQTLKALFTRKKDVQDNKPQARNHKDLSLVQKLHQEIIVQKNQQIFGEEHHQIKRKDSFVKYEA